MDIRDFTKFGRKVEAIGLSYDYNWLDACYTRQTPFEERPEPPSSYTCDGGVIEIPTGCRVYHEVELALVIGKGGRDISVQDADDHISGYALALGMTARNVQAEARKRGMPWTTAKGFETFIPISDLIPRQAIPNSLDVTLEFHIKGKVIQKGNTSELIYSPAELISYASGIMTLEAGDVILTGSPRNVGPIQESDRIAAQPSVDGGDQVLAKLELQAVGRSGNYVMNTITCLSPKALCPVAKGARLQPRSLPPRPPQLWNVGLAHL